MNKQKVIVVLGGWLVLDAGQWRTTDERDLGDKHGPLYDRWRVLAAVYRWRQDQTQLVAASGGRGVLDPVLPSGLTIARVIAGELVELGVPQTSIIEEATSGTTYQQLRELAKLAGAKDWRGLLLITNDYHLPRLEAMIESAPGLESLRLLGTHFLGAETVLLEHDRGTWEPKIQAAYQSESMIKRQAMEAAGVRDIESGKYQFK